ncbi:MAG: preprotein translocase subunit SecG [Tidjanibacter sp.]|nr:preprotein translocase subunit SecG [Tidjanibacter sp.]
MYSLFIILIIIASLLIVFAVLAQSPKSGMAANFGASNQVMGVRQTADFLEKFTWTMAISIVVLSLLATIAMSSHSASKATTGSDAIIEEIMQTETQIPNQITLPAAEESAPEAATEQE